MITMLLAIMTIVQLWRMSNWFVEDLTALNAGTVHLSYLLMNPLYDGECGDPNCPCSYTGICTKNAGPEIGYESPDRWVKEY